jgi:broad specificity phosphatase PhoE
MAMIYLIRHGQASFASANYDQLSALGIQQANILGTTLKTRKTTIDKCFTGSMQRHHQTAHYCSLTWDIAFSNHENSVWNEYDHMELIQKYNPSLNNFEALANYIRQEKQPLKALQTLLNNAIKDWMANQHDYTLDWETFKAQIWSNLRQLAAEIKKGGSYFIFTSGGPITVVLMQLLGLRD